MKEIKDFKESFQFKELDLWTNYRIPQRQYYYLVSSFTVTDFIYLQIDREIKRLILNEVNI